MVPPDSCALRVEELNTALSQIGARDPFVPAGHSLGPLVSRLYASTHPDRVAGMVVATDEFVPNNRGAGRILAGGRPGMRAVFPPLRPPLVVRKACSATGR